MKRTFFVLTGLLVFLGMLAVFLYYQGRPAPVEMREEIYPCVVYYRKTHVQPRPMIAHIVTVDLTCKNIRILVTPPEKGDKQNPLRARTTSAFAREFGVQIAINGDGFTPWWSNSLFDYYPHPGDPVRPLGLAASNGRQYGTLSPKHPVLYINERKEVSFGKPIRKVYHAISGTSWLVRDRKVVEDLNDTYAAPRTAVGLDGPGTRLILIVVDGRQPLYSEGATVSELAELMLYYGGDNAIMLDGGGSSTMVIDWPGKGLQVMNSPIDLGIPGRERAVGNHLGIFALP
ncbi:MAG: phosphodiester glycosidase family protein [Anaerolineales bacterium]|nr:phosphodiester glycosidase family protein [Anaerolineales bacterium]MCX7754148.1 phosphodiester glycosidase family protein [Anaerolineales bacterium]MDW8278062.1 phosphodiester glycosidase family protein [Anaerolineales bacterium]